MAVTIGEMQVEVTPAAAPAPTHGAGSGAASGSGKPDHAEMHKMLAVLHERKLRLKTN